MTKTCRRVLRIVFSFVYMAVFLTPPLPASAEMVSPLSPHFSAASIKGLTIYPDDPLRFDFIINPADSILNSQELRQESLKLIKYFLASLTVPEEELWVNLSPYEKDRVIPESFGKTKMGADLLAQDYLLKQVTSSLMYPENEIGESFWNRIYAKANEVLGKTEIPVNTFNKVWIVPGKASIYENGNSVFVTQSELKVMLEEDYLALEKNSLEGSRAAQPGQMNQEFAEIVREVIIPELEYEVNHGQNFAQLRQVYQSFILAAWFKQNLKKSFLGQALVDQNKTETIAMADSSMPDRIYQQYLDGFKAGVYDYIKEEYDAGSQQFVSRKYFSGGVALKAPGFDKGQLDGNFLEDDDVVAQTKLVLEYTDDGAVSNAMLTDGNEDDDSSFDKTIVFYPEDHGYTLDTTNIGAVIRHFEFENFYDMVDWAKANYVRFFDDLAKEGGLLGLRWNRMYDTINRKFSEKFGKKRDDWMVGGEINVYENVLERRVKEEPPETVANIVIDHQGNSRNVTLQELSDQVDEMAKILVEMGLEKGDVVSVILPEMGESEAVLLAAWKLGVIVNPLSSASGAKALSDALNQVKAKAVIAIDSVFIGNKALKVEHYYDEETMEEIPVGKSILDIALESALTVEKVVVFPKTPENIRSRADIPMTQGRDFWFDDLQKIVADKPVPPTAQTKADDPAIYHQSSGTTGAPKLLVQVHGGVLLNVTKELKYNFDVKPGDVFVGWDSKEWMMGPWKTIGVLFNGGISLIMEKGATDPLWAFKQAEKYKATHVGVSPIAIKKIMSNPTLRAELLKLDLSSVGYWGSTGSPWTKDAWDFLFSDISGGKVPIINISGGTDLYGSLVGNTPLSLLIPIAMEAALGVSIEVVDEDDDFLDEGEGELIWLHPFGPSGTFGLADDETGEKFEKAYFEKGNGHWYHGDRTLKVKVKDPRSGRIITKYFILGRAGDSFKRKGAYVNIPIIENQAEGHPNVEQVMVQGVPDIDNTADNDIIVFYVPQNAQDIPVEQIQAEVAQRINSAVGKRHRVKPENVVPVPGFPQTFSNKNAGRLVNNAFRGTKLGDMTRIKSEGLDNIIEAVSAHGQKYYGNLYDTPEIVDRAMLEWKKGGIDFNPSNLDLQTEGSMVAYDAAMLDQLLQDLPRIKGFSPTILRMAPALEVITPSAN